MTDNNKIEEAKEKIFEKHFRNQNEEFVCIDHITEPVYLDYQIKQAIELGAKWMLKEFLKDSWHPYNEEPKNSSNILYLNADGDIYGKQYVKEDYKEGWSDFVCFYSVWKWAYRDDLFPKEGCNHD